MKSTNCTWYFAHTNLYGVKKMIINLFYHQFSKHTHGELTCISDSIQRQLCTWRIVMQIEIQPNVIASVCRISTNYTQTTSGHIEFLSLAAQENINQRWNRWRQFLLEVFTSHNGFQYAQRLTHWGRVTHICVSKLTIIGSDNGLSPGRRQAIIWTNAEILLIRPLGTNFSEMLIETLSFSFMKMRLKVSSA